MWDPSYGKPLSFRGAKYIDCLDRYKSKWEFEILLNKTMVAEEETLQEKEEAAIKEITVPIKIISAGNSYFSP